MFRVADIMKKILRKLLNIVLLALFATTNLSAQTAGSMWMSSRQMSTSYGTTVVPGELSIKNSTNPFSSQQQFTSSTRICYTGSRYSSTVTRVGAMSISETADAEQTMTKRRTEGYPDIPFRDPVGEVPFALMLLLIAGYCLQRSRKQKKA